MQEKLDALNDEENPAQSYCVEQALLELADEPENIADTFTDEERTLLKYFGLSYLVMNAGEFVLYCR